MLVFAGIVVCGDRLGCGTASHRRVIVNRWRYEACVWSLLQIEPAL